MENNWVLSQLRILLQVRICPQNHKLTLSFDNKSARRDSTNASLEVAKNIRGPELGLKHCN